MNSNVTALRAYDDGGGEALYAGGFFMTAGGVAAKRLAKWDGSSWSALGGGVSGQVDALAVYDVGGGQVLCAGGRFTSAFDSSDSYLAAWGCGAGGGPTTYCTAGTSAGGCQAALSASGTPSATSASGFTLSAALVEGSNQTTSLSDAIEFSVAP